MDRHSLRHAVVLLSLVFGLAAATAAFAVEPIQVTQARWKAAGSVLRIEGVAQKPDDVLLVRDAETATLIGSVAVRADGKWKLKVREPNVVPSRVRIESSAGAIESEVDGVPLQMN